MSQGQWLAELGEAEYLDYLNGELNCEQIRDDYETSPRFAESPEGDQGSLERIYEPSLQVEIRGLVLGHRSREVEFE